MSGLISGVIFANNSQNGRVIGSSPDQRDHTGTGAAAEIDRTVSRVGIGHWTSGHARFEQVHGIQHFEEIRETAQVPS